MSNLPAVIESSAKAQGLALTDVNLIMPTETFGAVLGEFDKLTIETVRIDSNDSQQVYEPNGSGKGFALGKVPLQKIASALSIQWHPQYTGIVESNSVRSRAKAVGIMKKPNGETIVQTDEKTIDLDIEREDLRAKATKNAEGGKVAKWENRRPIKEPWSSDAERERWIDLEIETGLKQKRKFKDELAMTGAKLRVIRAFIAIKPTFTADELSKPLAFPRVMLDTSKLLSNPDTRDIARQQITGAVRSVFGTEEATESVAIAEIEAPSESNSQTVVDDDEPFALESETAEQNVEDAEARERAEIVAKIEEWIVVYREKGYPSKADGLEAILDDPSLKADGLRPYLNSAAKFARDKGW